MTIFAHQLIYKSVMRKFALCLCAMFSLLILFTKTSYAAELRRPISPEQPMWLIHLDTWNYPDPERIIELIPDDILPYCVFNISLSASDNVCISGPNVCDSWLKACAAKNVWCTVQCASGGHSRFSDFDLTYYERYFNEYPNFIGWNFAEQFWGFGEEDTPTFPERLALFGEILKICNRYGGYLIVSFTQAEYSADMMPIAYMKRNAIVNEQLTNHPENFICCEKYTMKRGFFEIESNCLGAYLGGYAGQYGIRFDQCGWATSDEDAEPFVTASGAIPIMEHVMLTGETVIDGPELIWQQDTKETNRISTTDGYSRRNWDFFSQFVNINIDEFRKILDGTVRILSREEVIDRTKICVINDLKNGNFDDYTSPASMFHGLYRQDYDGTVNNPIATNIWWMKKTGRYPTFPQVYGLLDETAQKLIGVKKSEYSKRWPTVDAKVAEFNKLFPQEYTGDIYAAHAENTWMTYNPYQYEHTNGTVHTSSKRAKGNIPFLYNTSESISFDYAPYSMAVMKEFSDSILLYMTNYRTTSNGGEYARQTDTVYIYGASEIPELTWKDRAKHTASKVVSQYENGVFKIAVTHNGPVELYIKSSGNAENRLTEWTPANIQVPAAPPVYTGTRQYEGEFFDYKGGASITTNGYYGSYKNYYGQGYMAMGTNSSAMVRDTIYVDKAGTYSIGLRYMAPNNKVTVKTTIGTTSVNMALARTYSTTTWKWSYADFELKEGVNVVTIGFAGSPNQVLLDCISVTDTEVQAPKWVSLSLSSLTAPSVQQGAESDYSTIKVLKSGIDSAVTATIDNAAFIVDVRGAKSETTSVDVKLDASMPIGDYEGVLTIVADTIVREIPVVGSITPGIYSVTYDFENEVARTSAKTPPATDVKAGYMNGSTAGVVNYTDNSGHKSKMLKIYSANSSKHATGVLNLAKFTNQATDYSITWRQVITSSNIAHKNGVLLRGNTKVVGNSSRGYTQGIYAGYYISVYNHGTATDIRMYKSTSATNLSMMTQNGINLSVATGQSVWYRASVSGSTKVTLKLEYSLDGKTWQTATTTTDESEPFQMGATQFVWGLDSSHNGFNIDDLTFTGVTYDETVTGVGTIEMQSSNGVVYDVYGRAVGSATEMESLPSGIYIVNGQKFFKD